MTAATTIEVKACPFNDPACVDFCVRPQVCGSEPE
jgi:hypothetical protein